MINQNNFLQDIEQRIETIYELYKIKKVVRNGKVKKKKVCPDGYKWSESEYRCKLMTPDEKIKRRRAAKKAKFKKKAKKNQAIYKRKKSLQKRKILNLK